MPYPAPSVQESKERKKGQGSCDVRGFESSLWILQAQQDPVQCGARDNICRALERRKGSDIQKLSVLPPKGWCGVCSVFSNGIKP